MKVSSSNTLRSKPKSAFTLVELLIAMTITSIILLVMLSLTATVADAWKRSRGAVFSNASARAAFDRIVTDFESAYYVQSIGGAEWFRFLPDDGSGLGDATDGSSAPTWAMFYTSPMDRDVAQAGDVIGLSYRLANQPVLEGSDPGANYKLWALYRAFPLEYGAAENPAKVTFDELLGKSDIHKDFWSIQDEDLITRSTDYLLAANVLDFQVVSWIRKANGNLLKVPSGTNVSVTSEGVRLGGAVEPEPGDRLYAVEISLTILSDAAIDHMREGTFRGLTVEKFLQQNSWSFTRLIRLYPESELTIQ